MRILTDSARSAVFRDGEIIIVMESGAEIRFPSTANPRLARGTTEQLSHIELSPYGIHWPELDEDISVENMLLGQPSGEGPRSFARWKDWYRRKVAEPGAAPNDGPATQPGNSGLSEGRPSVI